MQEAIKRGSNINPNSQTSQLGDGVTIIKSCGEVDVSLYRNAHKLRFRAIVAQHLHYPVIGGTTFIRDNNITQNFVHNQISLLGNKCTVPSTQREALLPITQQLNSQHTAQYLVPSSPELARYQPHNHTTHTTPYLVSPSPELARYTTTQH